MDVGDVKNTQLLFLGSLPLKKIKGIIEPPGGNVALGIGLLCEVALGGLL